MKIKYVVKSKYDFEKWCNTCNFLAQSLCPHDKVLKEFNSLNNIQRNEIKDLFLMYDRLRASKIPENESEAWMIGIMVDANIIACEYDIDPLTVTLCMNPICRPTERITIK